MITSTQPTRFFTSVCHVFDVLPRLAKSSFSPTWATFALVFTFRLGRLGSGRIGCVSITIELIDTNYVRFTESISLAKLSTSFRFYRCPPSSESGRAIVHHRSGIIRKSLQISVVSLLEVIPYVIRYVLPYDSDIIVPI